MTRTNYTTQNTIVTHVEMGVSIRISAYDLIKKYRLF
jgi:hypothetical protein